MTADREAKRNPAVTAPAIPSPSPRTRVTGPRAPRPRTRRNVELGLLLFVAVILVDLRGGRRGQRDRRGHPGLLGAGRDPRDLLRGAHIAIRILAPYADPVILPAVALINGIGVAFLRRLDLARAGADQRADLSVFGGDGVPAARGGPRPP